MKTDSWALSPVTDSAGLESSRTVYISNKFIGAATAVSGSHSVVDLLLLLLLSRFSRVRICATPEMEAHQVPLSLGFSMQEHWSGLPFPSPGVLNTEEWEWEEHPQLKRLERLRGCVWAVILLPVQGLMWEPLLWGQEWAEWEEGLRVSVTSEKEAASLHVRR